MGPNALIINEILDTVLASSKCSIIRASCHDHGLRSHGAESRIMKDVRRERLLVVSMYISIGQGIEMNGKKTSKSGAKQQ